MRLRIPRIRLNLAWKILISLAFIILVFIPLGAYLFISQSIEILNTEAESKAQILYENYRTKGISMARNIALNISGAVAGSDFTFLQNIISQTVASDKEIRFAVIENTDGRALVHSDPLKALQILDSEQDIRARDVEKMEVFEYEDEGEDIMEVAIPIMFGFERWGTLRVAYTLHRIKDEIQKAHTRQRTKMRDLTKMAIIIAAISMVCAIIIALFFSRRIVNAIRKIMGVTQRVAEGDFTQRVEINTGDEVETLGHAVNIMTENLDRLTQEVFHKARMESELQTAELVQRNIMPKRDPKFPNIEFASYFRSASETGGDWYAYTMQDKGETLNVVIADVTGHGLPAALLTEAGYSCLQTMTKLQLNLKPSATLKMLNQVLISQMGDQYRMTAFISQIHLPSLTMCFANSGHNMPLMIREGDRKLGVLSARGPRLGDCVTDDFEEKTMGLGSNQLLFWYTDGLLDCENEAGEVYGKRRLMTLLTETRNASSTAIRDTLVDDIMRFSGGSRPPDDITFIVGKVL